MTSTADNELSATLAQLFPDIPLQSVVRCVWDAESAVEYAAVDASDRAGLVERLARAHLEELMPFYTETEEQSDDEMGESPRAQM
jgi:hypothetical protein